jgi:hypothetical protein
MRSGIQKKPSSAYSDVLSAYSSTSGVGMA